MRDQSASPWAEVTVAEVIERHFCGPSPDCEERPVFDDAEWGVLKTTAITWSGWNQDAHKVLPRSYWGREGIEVKAGDVLVTKAGPRHRVAVVTHVPATRPQLVVSGKMIGLRPRSDLVLPQVLAGLLALGGPQKYIHDRTTGMAESQVNFANDVLLATPLRLPPLPEQTEIAQVAGALDTTIRQTEAIVEKLKLVKQGLLHDLLTRGIDANGELRPPQSEAPHLYKASPLGWIPREWEVQPLANYMSSDITYGIVQAGPHVEGGVPYIRTGDMSGDQLSRASLQCTTRRIADSFRRSEVRAGNIVMAIRATVGRVLPVPENLDGANLTQGTARLAPNACTDATFLLWAIRHQRAQNSILGEIKGTTFAEITLAALREVPLAAPVDLAEQRLIGERVSSCDARIKAEHMQAQKLNSLKSGLMDDLLTGRVRVTSTIV